MSSGPGPTSLTRDVQPSGKEQQLQATWVPIPDGQYRLAGPSLDTADGNGDPTGWSPELNEFLSSWTGIDGDALGSVSDSAPKLNNIGSLLHSSFDLWSALDGPFDSSYGHVFQGPQQNLPSF